VGLVVMLAAMALSVWATNIQKRSGLTQSRQG